MSNSKQPAKTVNCPTCGKPALWNKDNPWRPFCSERCKLIDLGEWFDERHRIADQSPPGDEQR